MKHTIEIELSDNITNLEPNEHQQGSLFVTGDTDVVELVVKVGDKAQFILDKDEALQLAHVLIKFVVE